MSRREDPFYSAKLPAKRAFDHIDALDQSCRSFLNERVFEFFTDYKDYPFQRLKMARITRDVPDELEDDAVRLLASFRSALDKAIHGSALILGSRSLSHTNFPFAENKKALKSQLARGSENKGPFRGIPDELHDFLLELRPYPSAEGSDDGNDLLAVLGLLSNPAKHENVLMIDLEIQGFAFGSGCIDSMSFNGLVWNESHTEAELWRSPLGDRSNINVTPDTCIALKDAGPMTGRDFVAIARDMASMVESIVLGVEAKTAEALERRKS